MTSLVDGIQFAFRLCWREGLDFARFIYEAVLVSSKRAKQILQDRVVKQMIDENEEMIEMVEANRQYQNNVEVISTLRGLMMRTINMGK